MGARRARRTGKIIVILMVFMVIFVGVFLGVQFFTKTGIFRIPGVVHYDDSLTSDEIATFEKIFDEKVDLDKDVTITGRYTLEEPTSTKGEYLSEILVPVTDFYNTETNLEVSNVAEMFDESFRQMHNFELIPVLELDFSKKLLSISGEYYLDKFKTGAVYRIIKFDSEKLEEEIEPLVAQTFDTQFPSIDTTLTFAQTGVTALSRRMNARLNAVGGDATYFATEIGPFLSAFDITHTSNESSFTNYASSANICSNPKFIDTLTTIGLDVVELTGNHNQDCGDQAALDTIDLYNEKGIRIVGGGKTATEAAEPLEINKKGTGITMLAFNQSTGGATLDNTPGANQYHEATAAQQIKEAKARGNVVIVDIQYYECNAYASNYEDPVCDRANSSAGDQVGFFRHLIDLGADVVVGTSAHQAQTFELYGDGAIYYGLGNLFFDQTDWPGTTRSLVLAHYFYNGKLLQTKMAGTVYGKDMQTKLLDEDTLKWWLDRLIKVKP